MFTIMASKLTSNGYPNAVMHVYRDNKTDSILNIHVPIHTVYYIKNFATQVVCV